jgi:hypothetical protein
MGHPAYSVYPGSFVEEQWKGFAHLFRPTYAGANVGHPFYSIGVPFPLGEKRHHSVRKA